jgi:hypothetical protein
VGDHRGSAPGLGESGNIKNTGGDRSGNEIEVTTAKAEKGGFGGVKEGSGQSGQCAFRADRTRASYVCDIRRLGESLAPGAMILPLPVPLAGWQCFGEARELSLGGMSAERDRRVGWGCATPQSIAHAFGHRLNL